MLLPLHANKPNPNHGPCGPSPLSPCPYWRLAGVRRWTPDIDALGYKSSALPCSAPQILFSDSLIQGAIIKQGFKIPQPLEDAGTYTVYIYIYIYIPCIYIYTVYIYTVS